MIQFLAGAPELLARYHNAPPAAAALIDAAMDARRLGMGAGLPLAFLEAAAPGYLTDAEWDGLGEDWLEQALAYAVVPCKGARGPLTRIRPRPARHAARHRGDRPDGMAAAAGMKLPASSPTSSCLRIARPASNRARSSIATCVTPRTMSSLPRADHLAGHGDQLCHVPAAETGQRRDYQQSPLACLVDRGIGRLSPGDAAAAGLAAGQQQLPLPTASASS